MTLTFDLLTSKSNQFMCPQCTKVVNLVKFTQAVYKIPRSQTSVTFTDGQTTHKTECIQHRSNSGRSTNLQS